MSGRSTQHVEPKGTPSVAALITERYAMFSAGHRRLADFVLASPHEAALMTLDRIAEASGVSAATASRFAAKLGLAGHPNLKRLLHAELKDALRPVEELVETIVFGGLSPMAPWTRSMEDDIRRIRDIEAVGGDPAFARAVARLAQARRVYVIGFGSSAFIAQYAVFYMSSLRSGCEALVDVSGMEGVSRRLLDVTMEDVAMVIGFARYSAQIVGVVERLNAHQVPMICVTDHETSPIAVAAAECFLVGRKPGYVLTGGGAGALALVEALLRGTATALGREAVEERSARLVSLLGDVIVNTGAETD